MIWRVMPFGLTNAPATFQRLMDIHFAEYINKFRKVYIDDLLIYSNDFDDHLIHIERTLAKLAQAGLKASLEKTMWATNKVPLGYILSPGKMEMDPAKVADALIPTPDKVINLSTAKPQSLRKLVRIFLRLTGFYRTFIKDLSQAVVWGNWYKHSSGLNA